MPKVRNRINNFLLNVIGLDPSLPIWQGREGFLTKSNYRLVPDKYVESNFTNNRNTAEITHGLISGCGELDTGFESYKSGWEEIKMQESIDFEHIVPNLTHEEYHKIFFGEQAMRNFIIGDENIPKQNQITTFLMEGTVELLKQINLEFDSIKDNKNEVYTNEVAFMKYLLDQVAVKVGYSKALKWGAMGGTVQPFVQYCKEIRTEIMPNGFDIYSIEESNLVSVDKFYEQNPNKNKNSDLSFIIQKLRNSHE